MGWLQRNDMGTERESLKLPSQAFRVREPGKIISIPMGQLVPGYASSRTRSSVQVIHY
jgi:hypothetical protein